MDGAWRRSASVSDGNFSRPGNCAEAGLANKYDPTGGTLNERQTLFVEAIVAGKSGTAAAVAAGYSEHMAGSKAYRLMKLEKINKAIAAKTSARFDAAAPRVIGVLERIVMSPDESARDRISTGKVLLEHSAIARNKKVDVDVTVDIGNRASDLIRQIDSRRHGDGGSGGQVIDVTPDAPSVN